MLSRREMIAAAAAGLVPGGLHPRLAAADAPNTNVFEAGTKPTDYRLKAPKTLNDHFPFAVPATKDEWEVRRRMVREQLLVANGLWPLPEKPPLSAVVHGKVHRDGYTVEKVFFASLPGHTVTGNLYRPTPPEGKSNPQPGVLFAHGHWANGRFHDAGEKAGKASVAAGGEPDLDRGRFFMQAIPVTLARTGFVVFQYDMVGNADSTALPHAGGFRDAAALLRLQSAMGLQTWNSIRALDFLTSLPDVDAKRLGMTGASGGGTQTFILAALDDRLTAAFPAVMVSTAMQGGCVCENAPYLRVHTGNVEIAGLFAPKPLAFSAANDWTKDFLTSGFPELKKLYALYGKEENVAAKAWLEYGHQYNRHAREFMYAWFSKHLLGKDGAVAEQPYQPTPPKELSVFDAEHPRPKGELDAAKLREAMTTASDKQIAALAPKDAASLAEFRKVVGTALRVMVGDELPKEVAVRKGPVASKHDGFHMHRAVLGRKDEADAVPSAGVFGPKVRAGGPLVVWVHPKGKASLLDGEKLAAPVQTLVDAGCSVVAPDVFGVGELAGVEPYPAETAKAFKNYAGYVYGYNRTPLANRVHDILTFVTFGTALLKVKAVHLVGWGEAGPWVVLAKALAGDKVARAAADLNQFRFDKVTDPADPMMLPGAVKYGGLGAFLALCAPGEVLTHNHAGTGTGRLPADAYAAAGAKDRLTRSGELMEAGKVVEWLVK
jgi:dienelactone hydrolase